MILGMYFKKLKQYDKAKMYFKLALDKVVASKEEEDKIKALMKKMQIETVIDKLIKTLHYANNNSAYYKKIFATNGISISDLTSEEFNRIPFTHKKDLSVFNEEFLAVSNSDIFDITTTSGTTGEPVSFYLTRQDVDRLATNLLISS